MSVPDFSAYAEKTVSKDILQRVSEMSQALAEREKDLAEKEEEAKALSNEVLRLKRELIPSALNEAGLALVKLKSGEIVEVSEKVHASINKGKEGVAFQGMKSAELAEDECTEELAEVMVSSLWKKKYVMTDLTEEETQTLIEMGIPFDSVLTIHWATLNKWVKGAKARGLSVPPEIKVFEYQEAKITKGR